MPAKEVKAISSRSASPSSKKSQVVSSSSSKKSSREVPSPHHKYSVLLPCYNERENLPLMVAMLDDVFEKAKLDYEIVVVEDSSPDGTYEVALELQALYGNDKLKILKRPGKMGLGSAYIDGIKLCVGDFVILMDGDLSHHVSYAAIVDIVMGLTPGEERTRQRGCGDDNR